MKKQLAETGFAKENMDSALQKKTQFENDNDMDKLLAPMSVRIHLMSSMR